MIPAVELKKAEQEDRKDRARMNLVRAFVIAVFIGICLVPFVLPAQ